MKSLTKRLLTAAIAIPFLFFVAICFPQHNFLAFFILILIADTIGTYEMRENILSKVGYVPISGYLGIILPISEYIQLSFFPQLTLTLYVIPVIIGIIFALEIFEGAKDNFKDTIGRVGRAILTFSYPSLFAIYIVHLCFFESASWFILYFLLLVFGTDSFAYFFGIAFGKNNKGFIKASPNKSIAGYIGGIVIPTIAGFVAPLLFPSVFAYSAVQGSIIGLFTAVFACIGDLIESCFKRASGVKDSGIVIPGRGGILDSIDSIMIAAPLYILLTELFLGA